MMLELGPWKRGNSSLANECYLTRPQASSSDFKALVNRCVYGLGNIITRTKLLKGITQTQAHRAICRTSPTTISKTTTRSFLAPIGRVGIPSTVVDILLRTARHILLICDCRLCGTGRLYTGVSLGRGMPPIVSCRVGCNGVPLPQRRIWSNGRLPGTATRERQKRTISKACFDWLCLHWRVYPGILE